MGIEDNSFCFQMNDINQKEFVRIFLHLMTHHKKTKLNEFSENIVTLENYLLYVITYSKPLKRILITSHPENHKKLKEMLYNFMVCSCKINSAIDESPNIKYAIKRLIKKLEEDNKKRGVTSGEFKNSCGPKD